VIILNENHPCLKTWFTGWRCSWGSDIINYHCCACFGIGTCYKYLDISIVGFWSDVVIKNDYVWDVPSWIGTYPTIIVTDDNINLIVVHDLEIFENLKGKNARETKHIIIYIGEEETTPIKYVHNYSTSSQEHFIEEISKTKKIICKRYFSYLIPNQRVKNLCNVRSLYLYFTFYFLFMVRFMSLDFLFFLMKTHFDP
jgi:hypothetical protein